MGARLKLDEILREIIDNDHVYFQPPNNLVMQYPCIVYSRDQARTLHADNLPYRYTKRYQVTYIDRNVDANVPDKLAMLPMTEFSRYFAADNLHHDVFNIYF